MKYQVKYFKPEEFRCPCCGGGEPAQTLVLWLDLFRAAWGGPVYVNSGFRCEKHNKVVGGAEKSRHLLGCAADIRCKDGCDPETRENFKAMAWRMFQHPGFEIKEYKWGMHVAVPRDEQRKWFGGTITVL